MTPLHRTATLSVDTHLFKVLCENGANINALDCRGNSPLLAMCDVLGTEDYDFFEDWSTTSDDTYEDTNTTFSVQHDFLDYMLSLKNIQVRLSQESVGTYLCTGACSGAVKKIINHIVLMRTDGPCDVCRLTVLVCEWHIFLH